VTDFEVELFAPRFEVDGVHAMETEEGLVDGVAEILGSLMSEKGHDATSEVTIELVVAGEDSNLLAGKELAELKVGSAGFDAHLLGLVGTGDNTAVVVAEDHHGLAVEVGTEETLARDVAVIAINNGVHRVETIDEQAGYLS
jgi:hypothetical protein